MKIKLFLTPAFVVAMIIFTVWILKPAYSEFKEASDKLKESKGKLADIQDKVAKAKQLSQELAASGEQKNIITEYLPEGKQEEQIINYINDVTFREGVLIYNISISQKEPSKEAAVALSNSTPSAKNLSTSFKLTGKYESVKNVLSKLANLKRHNVISVIKITKETATNSEGSATSSDTLSAEVSAEFKYLEKITNLANADISVFSQSKFDMAIANEIKQTKNTEVTKLSSGTAGRTNPFIP